MTELRSETRERNGIWPSCALRNDNAMITHNYACLCIFTHVYACLRMLRMKTLDYVPDKIMFAHVTQVYACYAYLLMLSMFMHVYTCLRMFTHVTHV